MISEDSLEEALALRGLKVPSEHPTPHIDSQTGGQK